MFKLYKALANSKNIKVRSSVAQSIYDVAKLIGEELAEKDLV